VRPRRNDAIVSRPRSLLARALAALLLLQWAVGPAHCLLMAATAFDGAAICHAADPAPGHDNAPISADQCCPLCHVLGQAALAPTPPSVPELIAWSAAPPPPATPSATPHATRTRPQQPRAPPARSA